MSASWFSIGHVTHLEARTGCTVILFDHQVPAVCDVRGGAPGTRETTLLDGSRRSLIDALVLSGGSAFGLSTADGVMRYLAEHGRGHATSAGPVPLVPAAIIFDLAQGEARAPDASDGYAAAAAATRGPWVTGAVGAGAGATAAKISGTPITAGVGIAVERFGEHEVTAVVVLNAVGDIVDPANGLVVAGQPDAAGRPQGRRLAIEQSAAGLATGQNTTLGALMIMQPADAYALNRCCISAHDAFARCVTPAHTPFDGDLFFAAAPAAAPVEPTQLLGLCCAVEIAVERAILGIFQEVRAPGVV